MLTQERLKELLHYDPEAGLFTWLVSSGNGVKVGDIAGSFSHGYIQIRVKGKLHQAHRLVWLYMSGVWPKDQIDHINHIRDDNRIVNLREATHRENGRNRSMKSNNKSGVTGVHRYEQRKKWVAQIKVDDKLIYLGCFTDKFEAVCARKSAENKFGFHPNHGTM